MGRDENERSQGRREEEKSRKGQAVRGERREAHGKRWAKRGEGEEREESKVEVRGQVQLRSPNRSEGSTVPLGAR